MKKDVNFIFFGLLLLLLVAMVGVMLYSDFTYRRVSGQYVEFKDKFDAAQAELNASRAEVEAKELALMEKEKELVDILKELNVSKQKESSLSTYYANVKSEKEVLNESLADAVADRDRWRADYESGRLELSTCQRNYELEKRSYSTCQGKILTYANLASEAIKDIDELSTTVDAINCTSTFKCGGDKDEVIDLLSSLQTKVEQIK